MHAALNMPALLYILSTAMLTNSALKCITCLSNVTLNSSQIYIALGGETFIV